MEDWKGERIDTNPPIHPISFMISEGREGKETNPPLFPSYKASVDV